MSDAEKRAFERNPHFAAAVRMRRWDDAGKVRGMRVAGLEHYLGMIDRVRITQ